MGGACAITESQKPNRSLNVKGQVTFKKKKKVQYGSTHFITSGLQLYTDVTKINQLFCSSIFLTFLRAREYFLTLFHICLLKRMHEMILKYS